MEHLKPFLHRSVIDANLRDGAALARLGARPRYVPPALSAFDEFELAMPFDPRRDLVVAVALERGKVERVLLGLAAAGDDEAEVGALRGEDLAAVLDRHAAALAGLFAWLTGERERESGSPL